MCRFRGIKEVFTTTGGPHINRVTARALGLIVTVALVDRTHASHFFPAAPLNTISRCGLKRPSRRTIR